MTTRSLLGPVPKFRQRKQRGVKVDLKPDRVGRQGISWFTSLYESYVTNAN